MNATRRDARRRGFTLVEILVVLAIIVLLFSLVVLAAGTYYARAYRGATESLMLRLQDRLDSYRRITGEYPPDGIDYPVENDEGTTLQGSACIHYYLTRPIVVEEISGSVTRKREYAPVMNSAFTSRELSEPDDTWPGGREIVDGWGNGIHYDNTQNGRFEPQHGEVHYPPLDDTEHPLDPREVGFEPPAPRPGETQSNGFDFWSHAEAEHFLDAELTEPIASWNLTE